MHLHLCCGLCNTCGYIVLFTDYLYGEMLFSNHLYCKACNTVWSLVVFLKGVFMGAGTSANQFAIGS